MGEHGLALSVAVLATWRLCHLVAHEDGPWDAIVRLRQAAGDGALGRLMDCAYCQSLWWAAPFAAWLAHDGRCGVLPGLALWLAISGGACLIEKLTNRPAPGGPKE
jgi:hypothetical protein